MGQQWHFALWVFLGRPIHLRTLYKELIRYGLTLNLWKKGLQKMNQQTLRCFQWSFADINRGRPKEFHWCYIRNIYVPEINLGRVWYTPIYIFSIGWSLLRSNLCEPRNTVNNLLNFKVKKENFILNSSASFVSYIFIMWRFDFMWHVAQKMNSDVRKLLQYNAINTDRDTSL